MRHAAARTAPLSERRLSLWRPRPDPAGVRRAVPTELMRAVPIATRARRHCSPVRVESSREAGPDISRRPPVGACGARGLRARSAGLRRRGIHPHRRGDRRHGGRSSARDPASIARLRRRKRRCRTSRKTQDRVGNRDRLRRIGPGQMMGCGPPRRRLRSRHDHANAGARRRPRSRPDGIGFTAATPGSYSGDIRQQGDLPVQGTLNHGRTRARSRSRSSRTSVQGLQAQDTAGHVWCHDGGDSGRRSRRSGSTPPVRARAPTPNPNVGEFEVKIKVRDNGKASGTITPTGLCRGKVTFSAKRQ